ncbi:hypothetical protein FKM82_024168, partial [Ascaphus truei]
STTVQEEVSTNTEALQSNRDQVKELKRTLQTLEIEVQGELSRKYGLENTLEETRASSTQQLQNIQNMICRLEAELRQVRNDNERQSNEYKLLLDIKSRLENEIATYRRLMDGDNTSGRAAQPQETGRKVKTIVQDVVDGRVVFSKVSEIHRKL